MSAYPSPFHCLFLSLYFGFVHKIVAYFAAPAGTWCCAEGSCHFKHSKGRSRPLTPKCKEGCRADGVGRRRVRGQRPHMLGPTQLTQLIRGVVGRWVRQERESERRERQQEGGGRQGEGEKEWKSWCLLTLVFVLTTLAYCLNGSWSGPEGTRDMPPLLGLA